MKKEKQPITHTPGPWRLSPGSIGNLIEGQTRLKQFEGDSGYRTVASFQEAIDSDNYYERETNQKANGLLIAAAPDLLKALETLAFDLETYRQMYEPNRNSDHAGLKKAKFAIAKAKGLTE